MGLEKVYDKMNLSVMWMILRQWGIQWVLNVRERKLEVLHMKSMRKVLGERTGIRILNMEIRERCVNKEVWEEWKKTP